MARDMSAEVQEYLGLCEALASSLARPGTRGINGVEFDDLVQEGLIQVWQQLDRKQRVDKIILKRRMLDYMKWLGRREPTPYGTMLPLDVFVESVSRDDESRTGYLTPKEEGDGTDPITFLGEVQGD